MNQLLCGFASSSSFILNQLRVGSASSSFNRLLFIRSLPFSSSVPAASLDSLFASSSFIFPLFFIRSRRKSRRAHLLYLVFESRRRLGGQRSSSSARLMFKRLFAEYKECDLLTYFIRFDRNNVSKNHFAKRKGRLYEVRGFPRYSTGLLECG